MRLCCSSIPNQQLRRCGGSRRFRREADQPSCAILEYKTSAAGRASVSSASSCSRSKGAGGAGIAGDKDRLALARGAPLLPGSGGSASPLAALFCRAGQRRNPDRRGEIEITGTAAAEESQRPWVMPPPAARPQYQAIFRWSFSEPAAPVERGSPKAYTGSPQSGVTFTPRRRDLRRYLPRTNSCPPR